MRCPFCRAEDSKVIDSRSAEDGNTIRRRRECARCAKRFTTYEVVEQVPLMVIKNDGRRVGFDKNKLLMGIIRSCEKRSISMESINSLANEIEKELRNTMEREIPTKVIGELVMEKLRNFDPVAYVRFASVYRKFTDLNHFKEELEGFVQVQKRK